MKNLFILILLLLSCSTFGQLTGYWQTDNGGCYQIRQDGNEVWWAGETSDIQRANNVFHGVIAGNNLTGIWCDMPSNSTQGCRESLSLRIENNNRMVKVASSSPYNGRVWTRQNGPCEEKEEYWEVTGDGGWKGIWTRQGKSKTFDAIWTKGGATITTKMSINIIGNKMTGERISSSDGVLCYYTGQVSADGLIVSGSGNCGSGSTFTWSAKIFK